MAIDNAPFISELNKNLPDNRDPRAEGAAQIRAVKTALLNSFPNVDAPVTATAEKMNSVFNSSSQVPLGAIIMWSNSTTPEGWVDCDGSTVNGIQTPDLRGLFVRGVDTQTPLGVTGGADEADLSQHLLVKGHALAKAELPAVGLKYTDRYYSESKSKLTSEGASNVMNNDSGGTVGSKGTDTDNDGMLFVEDTTEDMGQGVAHSHGLEQNTDNLFDNRPAFYALRYLCFVGV